MQIVSMQFLCRKFPPTVINKLIEPRSKFCFLSTEPPRPHANRVPFTTHCVPHRQAPVHEFPDSKLIKAHPPKRIVERFKRATEDSFETLHPKDHVPFTTRRYPRHGAPVTHFPEVAVSSALRNFRSILSCNPSRSETSEHTEREKKAGKNENRGEKKNEKTQRPEERQRGNLSETSEKGD